MTRSSNNYGPNQYPEKLIPLFISNIIEGRRLPIYGDGQNIRDWIHVDDNCRAIHKVLMSDSAGEIYNIGGGNEFSNLTIANSISNLMGFDSSIFDFVQDRAGHDFRYSVDSTKIKDELGFEPELSFDLGLLNTIDWYRENEHWWKELK